MRIRPFGLHKKTVNSFIKRIQNAQEQDLVRLSDEITSAELQRNKLLLLLQPINQASLVIDEEALRKEIQEQLAQELKDKLRKELETELRSELATVMRAELKSELREEVREDLRRELQEAADSPAESDQGTPFSKAGKVLHFKQVGSKLRIVPQAQLQPQRLSDTAAMTTQPQTSYESQNVSSSMPPVIRKKQVKAVGMGFWENADDYLEPENIEDQQFYIPNAYTNTYAAPQGALTYFESLPNAPEEAAAALEAPAVPKQQERLQSPRTEPSKRQEGIAEQTATLNGDTATTSSTGKSKQSPAITEEIRVIRQKYIVGKIAGEDVYDSAGKLIIAKQFVITGEVVDKVDAEGKLAELIVNMIIPGLGED
jgi:hypothetical protein